MAFGLKNVDTTYQWAMMRIFDELIYYQEKCYIYDIVAKIKERENQLYDLRTIFDQLH